MAPIYSFWTRQCQQNWDRESSVQLKGELYHENGTIAIKVNGTPKELDFLRTQFHALSSV